MVRQIRWLGPENCKQVFAVLGWEHPDEELDHSRIRGLGPDRDQVAYWGDLIEVDDAGVSHVTPEPVVSIPRAALDDLYMEVEQSRRELNPLRDLAPSDEQRRNMGDDDEFFIPGRTYITENGYYRFACMLVVAGVALGIQEELMHRFYAPEQTRQRVWMSVKPAGCWIENESEGKQ